VVGVHEVSLLKCGSKGAFFLQTLQMKLKLAEITCIYDLIYAFMCILHIQGNSRSCVGRKGLSEMNSYKRYT
jgi:hypothetical protein